MIARRFGRIVNVTSRAVKMPLPDLGLSNGARAGLTAFVAGLSRQVAKHNVAINNLLPGPFDTDRTIDGLRKRSAKAGQDYDSFAAARRAEVPDPPLPKRGFARLPRRYPAGPRQDSGAAYV